MTQNASTEETPVAETDSRKRIEAFLEDVEEIPSLPQIAIKVTQMARSESTSAAELGRVVASDQALAVRVLRAANSAYYALPREITTLKDAIGFLGFKQLCSIVMAISAFEFFGGRLDDADIARGRLWKHTLLTAISARHLAEKLGSMDREEAFLAGLIHDIGKVVLDRYAHDNFVQILRQAEAGPVPAFQLEEQAWGFHHADLGGALGERWDLPESLCRAIAHHHEPWRSPTEASEGAYLVFLANQVAHIMELQVTEEGRAYVIDDDAAEILLWPATLADHFGADVDRVIELASESAAVATEQESFYRGL
ncbi:MAG: HDOD domain-containing protein [Armatimonadia bacterium]|nr:HDOD domain-containing protein [Armatimonadia bacterium]